MQTRREFLGALAAAGAAGLFHGCSSLPKNSSRKLIDTHHHFYAPEYQKAWLDWENKRGLPHFPSQLAWSPAKSLEAMDQGGVDTAMLSLASTPGVWFDAGAAEATRMARLCNEYAAQMVRDHPGRFGLFATLPMVDVDASEGDRLRARHAEGRRRRPADELRRQVAGRRGVPADLRGAEPQEERRVLPSARGELLRTPFRRHLPGGDRSAARHDARGGEPPSVRQLRPLPRHPLALLARGRASMAALLKLVPGSQVVFGSDYPYVPIAEQAAALRSLGLDATLVAAIESGNARRLLGISALS